MLKSIARSTLMLSLAAALIILTAAALLVAIARGLSVFLPFWPATMLAGICVAMLAVAGTRLILDRWLLTPIRRLVDHVRLESDFGYTPRMMPKDLATRTDAVGLLARQIQQLIEALRSHNASLLEQTMNDPLTGLGNRRLLEHRLNLIVPLSRRLHCTVSAMMIDVDHFKAFNDNYGHPAGDACLVEIAGVLRDTFRRETDVVVRLGGEEFLVLLIDTVQEEAWALADAMRGMIQALGLPHAHSPTAPVVTVSVGVVTSPHGVLVNVDDMIADADRALYDCKAHGRNRVSARVVGVAPENETSLTSS
ncbi:GGDEF domain-containing protein [Salinicola rhizosphaerae]|uniref:diguanylate cyclase n=1 Tax=Salinicola rhizosphaerae TaxID=1443141 RepID=A0ABQ3DMX3_9GAMM|nr:GGDEF domain-containing protein [Salinicola rhizosphaerae]GHB08495.1 hypothetical protein GCM10009038_02470 [Salinicola rhizosphaerae]